MKRREGKGKKEMKEGERKRGGREEGVLLVVPELQHNIQ